MSGSVVQLHPEAGVRKCVARKTPGEERALIEKTRSLLEKGAAPETWIFSVRKLTSLVENGADAEVRECAICALMNIAGERPEYMTRRSMAAIMRAIGEGNERLSRIADMAAMVLVQDFREESFPVLLRELDAAGEEASERMVSTVKSIYSLSSEVEKGELGEMVEKHARRKGKKRGKERAKKRAEPPKKLAETGNVISLEFRGKKGPGKIAIKLPVGVQKGRKASGF